MPLPQGDTYVASYLLNMTTLLQVHNKTDGSLLRQLPLPVFDSVGGAVSTLCPGKGNTDFYFIYSSMTDPGTIYRCVPIAVPLLCMKTSLNSLNRLMYLWKSRLWPGWVVIIHHSIFSGICARQSLIGGIDWLEPCRYDTTQVDVPPSVDERTSTTIPRQAKGWYKTDSIQTTLVRLLDELLSKASPFDIIMTCL